MKIIIITKDFLFKVRNIHSCFLLNCEKQTLETIHHNIIFIIKTKLFIVLKTYSSLCRISCKILYRQQKSGYQKQCYRVQILKDDTVLNIFPVDKDVIISVIPALLVEKPYSVVQLVQYDTDVVTGRAQNEVLRSSVTTDRRMTAERKDLLC